MADTNIDQVIEQIKNEITVDQVTGIGTCSIRGAARLADVNDMSLSRAFKSSADNSPHKITQTLIQQGFEVQTILAFGQTGIPDVAVAVILEYYSFDAGKNCSEQAQLAYRAFARIGVRAWMRDIKSWHPPVPQQQETIEDFIIRQLPFEPKTWQCRFKPMFWSALFNLYGLRQEQRACARFIRRWIYDYFPVEVQVRLEEINPVTENGYRKNLIHQHFDDVMLELLKQHIELVITNLINADSKYQFKKLMCACPIYKLPENLKQATLKANGNQFLPSIKNNFEIY